MLLIVLKRVAIETHGNHIAPSRFHRLLNRQRYRASLSATEAYLTITVTNRQRGEAENMTAFDHPRHTVNLDELPVAPSFFPGSSLNAISKTFS